MEYFERAIIPKDAVATRTRSGSAYDRRTVMA
jgi:hypothetical protein